MSFFKYCTDVWIAAGRGKWVTSMLVLCWLAFPTAILTLFFPTDAVGLGYYLQGQKVPRLYTLDQVTEGEIKALAGLVSVVITSLLITMWFYRKARFSVALWPVAIVAAGGLYSGAWYLHSGFYFDQLGALAGASILVLMVACETVCEHFGKNVVFGKNVRPRRA